MTCRCPQVRRSHASSGSGIVAPLPPRSAETLHTTGGEVFLAARAKTVQEHLERLDGLVDRGAVFGLWERVRSTPPWPGPRLWIHGDLHPGNLLVSGGRLSAVIDFGDLAAGDPATDAS